MRLERTEGGLWVPEAPAVITPKRSIIAPPRNPLGGRIIGWPTIIAPTRGRVRPLGFASTYAQEGSDEDTTTELSVTSFTIPADNMAVCFWMGWAISAPDLPTPSGHGTWTVTDNFTFTDSVTFNARMAAWYFMPSSESTAALTITEGSNGWDEAMCFVYSVSEVVTTGSPRGADAIVQSASKTVSSATSISIGSGDSDPWSTPATDNVILMAALGYIDGTRTAITFDDAATWDDEFTDLTPGFNAYGSAAANLGDAWTTVGASWTNSSYFGGIALEIDNSGGGGPATALKDVIGGGMIPFAR